MNHLAFYRKYRPKTFDDVCGQEHVSSVLKYEVKEEHLSHAYLFCGSRGTGKTTCARILAKAANCLSPENGNPCGKCENCLSIENGSAIDVVEIDAASNTGVENIREITEEVSYAAAFLKRKVYIIDEVHMLSASAFNALLKTLEEPPEGVIFILATTEFNKLPSTIVSRCQRYDFRRIPADIIADRLEHIAKEEGISLDRDGAVIIARQAYGGMRDAVNLLDLCATVDKCVNAENVSEILGISRRDLPDRTARAVKNADLEELFDIVYEVDHSSSDVSVFFGDLLSYWRDMLVASTLKDYGKYLDLTAEETAMLKDSSSLFTKKELLFQPIILENALSEMKDNPSIKRNIAETALIKLCHPEYSSSLEALNVRVEELERKIEDMSLGFDYPLKAPSAKQPDNAENKGGASSIKESGISADCSLSEDKPSEEDDFSEISDLGEVSEFISKRDMSATPLVGMCSFLFSRKANAVKILCHDSFSAARFEDENTRKTFRAAFVKCGIAGENTVLTVECDGNREQFSVFGEGDL